MDDIAKRKWLDMLEELQMKTDKLYQDFIDNNELTDDVRQHMEETNSFIGSLQMMIEFPDSKE